MGPSILPFLGEDHQRRIDNAFGACLKGTWVGLIAQKGRFRFEATGTSLKRQSHGYEPEKATLSIEIIFPLGDV